jgi:nucleotide-binding universal stress UspA family protein
MPEGMPLFSTILVPVDGSQASMNAGRLAIRLAVLAEARIAFLYVVDRQAAQQIAASSRKDPQLVESELAASGDRCLRRLVRLAEEAGLHPDRHMRIGQPDQEIGALAGEQGADLVVIGQIGRGGLRRVLIGSVTERVIEHAGCPVLVVR